MKRLIAFISILMLASVVSGTAVSVTIYGTNKSNAQDNITCYGCNNTISVQAWNTSYVKNITIESKNGSGGDVVSFNISNVTAFQVQELKVNKTAVNAYQAGANGMLNFSYTVVGNKTLVLSPAINVNGYNMTWVKAWNGIGYTNQTNYTGVRAYGTVYQNTAGSTRIVTVAGLIADGLTNYFQVTSDSQNPPTSIISWAGGTTASQYQTRTFVVLPNHYYMVSAAGNSGTLFWSEWIR